MVSISPPVDAAARLRRVQIYVEELRRLGSTAEAEDVQFAHDLAEQVLAARGDGRPRDLLTTGQVALALGLSDQTVRNWVASGRLPAVRRGVRTMIPSEAVRVEIERSVVRSPRPEASAQETPGVDWHRQLLAALPSDITARLNALHDKLEDGRALSGAEQNEMAHLDREMADAAAGILTRVIRQGSAEPV